MSIIFAIILFSFLIFIHELGHFTFAKAFGVQVNEFSLFMGPAIWKKQRGTLSAASPLAVTAPWRERMETAKIPVLFPMPSGGNASSFLLPVPQ